MNVRNMKPRKPFPQPIISPLSFRAYSRGLPIFSTPSCGHLAATYSATMVTDSSSLTRPSSMATCAWDGFAISIVIQRKLRIGRTQVCLKSLIMCIVAISSILFFLSNDGTLHFTSKNRMYYFPTQSPSLSHELKLKFPCLFNGILLLKHSLRDPGESKDLEKHGLIF